MANILVVNAVNVAGSLRDGYARLDQSLYGHGRLVGVRADESQLNDLVTVCRNPCGFQIKGKHLFTLKQVGAHDVQPEQAPLERHSVVRWNPSLA